MGGSGDNGGRHADADNDVLMRRVQDRGISDVLMRRLQGRGISQRRLSPDLQRRLTCYSIRRTLSRRSAQPGFDARKHVVYACYNCA